VVSHVVFALAAALLLYFSARRVQARRVSTAELHAVES
jgi:hypothetical protein